MADTAQIMAFSNHYILSRQLNTVETVASRQKKKSQSVKTSVDCQNSCRQVQTSKKTAVNLRSAGGEEKKLF